MMSSITVTMLGLSGTGKTHACKSLFRMMEQDNSDHGVYLTADGSTFQEKMKNTDAIRNYAPETRNRFTRSGTEGVWELPLALCVDFRKHLPNYPILKVPLLDYAGGTVQTVAQGIRDTEDHEAKENAQKLLNSILEADVLMLLADANILSENPEPNASLENIRDAIGRNINDIFKGLMELDNSALLSRQRTVILMLTKCDSNLIAESLRKDDYCGLIARATTVFKPILRACRKYDWPFAVIPTSACGNGNAHTTRREFGQYTSTLDPNTEMEPYGFDIAFLYGLMAELWYRIDNKIDNSAATPNLRLNEKQRQIVEREKQRENKQKLQLYQELYDFLHEHLNALLDSPNRTCIIDEKSIPFFAQDIVPRKRSFLETLIDSFSL